MIEARIAKLVMVGCLALFALLVAFDNLTDYDTNYAFVRHVLSMDTTFPETRCSTAASPRPRRGKPGTR
jgi:predicted small integral membrane protein